MNRSALVRVLYALPIIGLLALTFFFFKSLNGPPPNELPSVLLDKPAPHVALPPLDARTQAFSSADLAAGHVSVVNLFASWCVPCRAEAAGLQALSHIPGVAVYGIVYKDTPEKARGFLEDVGNPYARIDVDADGRAGIDWGIQGVPETFVIDGRGIVRLRYEGPIVGSTLSDTILPAIEQAKAAG